MSSAHHPPTPPHDEEAAGPNAVPAYTHPPDTSCQIVRLCNQIIITFLGVFTAGIWLFDYSETYVPHAKRIASGCLVGWFVCALLLVGLAQFDAVWRNDPSQEQLAHYVLAIFTIFGGKFIHGGEVPPLMEWPGWFDLSLALGWASYTIRNYNQQSARARRHGQRVQHNAIELDEFSRRNP